MRYDIYYAMKPLHVLCKTVGLYPHSFNQNTKKNSRLLDVLWSFSLILSLAVCFIYRLVTTIQNPTRRSYWMADVIYVCTDYVAGLGCLIFGVTTQRNKCQLINYKIKKIDELFYLHNDRIHVYKKQRFTVIFSVILIISSTIPLCCFMMYSWEDLVPSNFIIFDQLCYYIVFIVSVRHVLYAKLLRDKFKGMNLQIVSIVHGILDVNFDLDVKNFTNTCAVIQFVSSRQRKMHTSNGTIEPTTSARAPYNYRQCLIRIHRLKHLHVELHSLTQLINFTFGLKIFLAIIWLIVINTLAFHLVAKYISTLSLSHNQIMRNDFQGILAIMWAVFASVFLFMISVVCHETSEEAAMSVSLVHSLLLDPCLSSDVSKELQLFSTQLTHLKIEFSACGFFAINLQFFYSTIGVICTYVIFFCQIVWLACKCQVIMWENFVKFKLHQSEWKRQVTLTHWPAAFSSYIL